MSAVTVHAMQAAIHVEEGCVYLDQSDEPGIFILRGGYTPDGAEKLAAELLMAAERARSKQGDAA